jgi:diguanylate cyclase (GGDEF)-like protein
MNEEQKLSLLMACTELLNSCRNEQELVSQLCTRIHKYANSNCTWISLASNLKPPCIGVVGIKAQGEVCSHKELEQLGDEHYFFAVTSELDALNQDAQRSPTLLCLPSTQGHILVCLLFRAREFLGTLNVRWDRHCEINQQTGVFFQSLANLISRAISGLRDISTLKQLEQIVHFQDNFDTLTGLANRRLFSEGVADAINRYSSPANNFVVVHISIDRFQQINDSLGYTFGDAFVQMLAKRFGEFLHPDEMIARIAAFDFGLILKRVDCKKHAQERLDTLVESLSEPFVCNGSTVYVTASIGACLYPEDARFAEVLLQHADAALLNARSAGGNNVQFYSNELQQKMAMRLELDVQLRLALQHSDFEMYFQPKVNLRNGHITGAEALIRWTHETLGPMSPAEFIPLSEETGLIVEIGAWTIDASCQLIRQWLDQGLSVPPISVNLSTRQFRQENLVEMVRGSIERAGIDPTLLVLEVTETTAMLDVESSIDKLSQLQDLGIKLSIDDFGTGYSSLNNLKRLPFDQLKIDRSFVRDIVDSPDDRAICLAMIGLAHTLKMTVVAEGVENVSQLHILLQHRCDEMQGFLFSKAVAPKQFADLLRERACLTIPDEYTEKRQTVLLVDDEQNILSAMKRLLRRDNYHVLTANSGAEGLEVLAQNTVDVIVSDQRMPGMIGADFLRRAKELYPATVRIMLSGYTELQSVTDAVNDGAIYKFLTKPWDDDLLREHIKEAMKIKRIGDENRELSAALVRANEEMAQSNHKMEQVLRRRLEQIARTELSLNTVREVLQKVPLSVIGVDDENLIVFVNEAAEELFESMTLLGVRMDDVLPELAQIMHKNEDGLSSNKSGKTPPFLIIDECAYRPIRRDLFGAPADEATPMASGMLIFFQRVGSSEVMTYA